MTKKIGIIGAGISGLYLANLLEKNPDYDYKIFEKRSQFDLDNSYGIQLSVNSIRLLNDIGFKKIDANEIVFASKINFFDARSSKKICDIDISSFNSEEARYATLKRSTLINFLLKKIPTKKIIMNIQPHSIEQLEKIKIYYSNNLTEYFDHLVISDGIFSKTKTIITKNYKKPTFYNSIAIRGIIKNFKQDDISIYLGSNFHFVIYPISRKKEFNFVSIVRKRIKKNELLKEKYFYNEDFLNSLFNKIFKKNNLDLKNKIQNIKSFPIYVSKKIERYNKKNIYFVGDALFAFPPSFAQGASQSVESANELYESIINNTDDYYKKRFKKLKSVNWRSKLNFFVFHLSNPITIYLRNLILKYLTKNKKFIENYLGKIYRN